MIVARRDIRVGEEITIDYGMIVPTYGKEMNKENRVCRCGSKRCRGQLGAYLELSDELKKEYTGFISEYLLSYSLGN